MMRTCSWKDRPKVCTRRSHLSSVQIGASEAGGASLGGAISISSTVGNGRASKPSTPKTAA